MMVSVRVSALALLLLLCFSTLAQGASFRGAAAARQLENYDESDDMESMEEMGEGTEMPTDEGSMETTTKEELLEEIKEDEEMLKEAEEELEEEISEENAEEGL